MLTFLPGPLRAIIAAILYTLLTFLLPIPIVLFGLLRYCIPIKAWQYYCTAAMHWLGDFWGDGSHLILWLTTKIHWDIQIPSDITPEQSCLVISNHQTWADIIVLHRALNRKIPLTRYFMKKQLAYVPIIGWACRLLDFPSMSRYSKEVLAKRPELRGRDIEVIRKACKKFQDIPVSWINYSEGTRFTAAKHQKLASPYQHLLPPRAGGVAFILATVGSYLHHILNMTVSYGKTEPTLWEIFTGKIHTITVRVEKLAISADLFGDYQNDPEFRQHFQQWLNQLWQEKDQLLARSVKQTA